VIDRAQASAPVAPGERLFSLDVIRGLALFRPAACLFAGGIGSLPDEELGGSTSR
jgi:hypothetical protein